MAVCILCALKFHGKTSSNSRNTYLHVLRNVAYLGLIFAQINISITYIPVQLDHIFVRFCFQAIAMKNSKGAFYSESEIPFSNLPIFQKIILSLKFEIPAHISKQLIQISSSGWFFGIIFC